VKSPVVVVERCVWFSYTQPYWTCLDDSIRYVSCLDESRSMNHDCIRYVSCRIRYVSCLDESRLDESRLTRLL